MDEYVDERVETSTDSVDQPVEVTDEDGAFAAPNKKRSIRRG